MKIQRSRFTRCLYLLATAPAALLLSGSAPATGMDAGKCSALAINPNLDAPVPGLKISAANWKDTGSTVETRGGKSPPIPAHCEISGTYGEHAGAIGGPYYTSFHMRLPQDWNGRYFFQGGGGSNGVVGDATGFNGAGNKSAIERGYAVISQDSGHDNAANKVADHGGDLVFGHDPQARADYGHASLKRSYDVGRYLLRQAYGREPTTKIFWGCSKGGQEGMAFAQRYPDSFDGIVAAAPGFALPRAAIAEAWDVQQFASILRSSGTVITLDNLKSAFSLDQYKLVADTVRATCDGDDGAIDGMINAVGQCTSARVVPALRKKTCSAANADVCLNTAQIDALANIMAGPRDSKGKQLYAPWAWDSGIAEPGWRVWKTGLEKGPPALNVLLGGGSLASVFTTPPTALSTDPAVLLPWQLAFNFDKDAPKIYATNATYKTSAWSDIGMRDTNLSAFRAHGGKMIVPHGISDPVFSVLDTINWWQEVDKRNTGRASQFVRVFPVPGMNHCGGGAATDRFDSLTALENWVLEAKAPDAILATAGSETPWPGRERPLCPYPMIAQPSGASFICTRPSRK
jgi:Tannase and feruloyl esterase